MYKTSIEILFSDIKVKEKMLKVLDLCHYLLSNKDTLSYRDMALITYKANQLFIASPIVFNPGYDSNDKGLVTESRFTRTISNPQGKYIEVILKLDLTKQDLLEPIVLLNQVVLESFQTKLEPTKETEIFTKAWLANTKRKEDFELWHWFWFKETYAENERLNLRIKHCMDYFEEVQLVPIDNNLFSLVNNITVDFECKFRQFSLQLTKVVKNESSIYTAVSFLNKMFVNTPFLFKILNSKSQIIFPEVKNLYTNGKYLIPKAMYQPITETNWEDKKSVIIYVNLNISSKMVTNFKQSMSKEVDKLKSRILEIL